MIKTGVVIEHIEGVLPAMHMGTVTAGEIPTLVDTLMGAQVWVSGARMIEHFEINPDDRDRPVLCFKYGDEI